MAGFSVSANTHEFHTGIKLARYFRARLINSSGSNQTYLRLYTYFGNYFFPSNSPLSQALGLDSDAIAIRGDDFSDEVTISRRLGVQPFTKFGYRTGLNASSGEQMVWTSTSNTFTPLTSAETFTIAYTSGAGNDGLGSTGALVLTFFYIDANGKKATTTHTLSNTGSDVTSFTGLGINRIAVSSSGSADANNAAISVTATTSGTVQAHIPAGESVTQTALYHVAHDSSGAAKWLWIKANRSSGGGNPKILVKGYIYNRLIQTRFLIFRATLDTQSETIVNVTDPVNFKLNPSDIVYFIADTDTSNSEIQVRFSLREYTSA